MPSREPPSTGISRIVIIWLCSEAGTGPRGDLVALDVGEHQPPVRAGESLAHGKAHALRGPDDHAHILAHRQAPMLRPPSTVTTEPVT